MFLAKYNESGERIFPMTRSAMNPSQIDAVAVVDTPYLKDDVAVLCMGSIFNFQKSVLLFVSR